MYSPTQALRFLREIVAENLGCREVIVVSNGGDGERMKDSLDGVTAHIFRKDRQVRLMVHEEQTRRGQWLGLLDAFAHWKNVYGGFDKNSVSLGVMLPGKGTRLSPLTQRFYGIKPLIPCLINVGGEWLTSAGASLFSWNLVCYSLEKSGFRGMAWKWGDEPQFPANPIWKKLPDFSHVDVIRFGSLSPITDELARNKEWLYCDREGNLTGWVRRREKKQLLKRLNLTDEKDHLAWIHIGSPAFSYTFLECAAEVFSDLPGNIWLDVDGYLTEALLYEPEQWENECKNNAGMNELLSLCPDFYERCRRLKHAVSVKKNKPFEMKVVDFGKDFYWADLGQLSKAREVFFQIREDSPKGRFARELAGISHLEKDERGNFLSANISPHVKIDNSVVIHSTIKGEGFLRDAVVVDSELGDLYAEPGSVIFGTKARKLHAGINSWAMMSVGDETLHLKDNFVHTSIPCMQDAGNSKFESWWANANVNVGAKEFYENRVFSNPRTFEQQQAIMRRQAGL